MNETQLSDEKADDVSTWTALWEHKAVISCVLLIVFARASGFGRSIPLALIAVALGLIGCVECIKSRYVAVKVLFGLFWLYAIISRGSPPD